MRRRFYRLTIPAVMAIIVLGFMSHTLAVPRGVTRPWGQPGAPAGSYGLSGFESINIFTGKLNFSLPFLNIGGRGEASTSLTLQIDRSWRNLPYTYTQIIPSMPAPQSTQLVTSCMDVWDAETSTLYGDAICNSADVIIGYSMPPSQQVPQTINTPVVMKDMLVGPGYGPGLLVARTAVSSVRSCFAYNTGSYNVSGSEAWITKTYLSFIAPDGTEYELVDTQTYGGPYENTNGTCNSTPHSRGTTFISSDGTGMTFISDAPINDDVRSITPNQFFENVGMPSGYLLMQDGSRYRVREGKIDWIRDRNGNLTTFTYGVQEGSSERKLISATDSVGRVTTIEYNVNDEELSPDGVPYGTCDRITYRGFGGEQRTIRIVKKNLSETLRPNSGYALKTATEMWRLERPSATAASLVNPGDMVSVLWLPDGRKYRFYYNPFVELARVELPTGGAIDYEHDYGLTLTMDNGSVTHNTNDLKFYRRLTERRVYTDKDDPSSLESITDYGQIYEPRSLAAPTPTPGGIRPVTEEQKDKNGNRVSFVKHYFHGDPINGNSAPIPEADSIQLGVDWMAGREVQTDLLSNDGATVLRRAKYTWQPRVPAQGTKMNYRPPRDVVLVETKSIIEPDGANLVTKQGSVNPQTGDIGFDQYNNQTDAWEYDYGVGEAGSVVRHTRTDFMTVNPVNSVDYTSPTLTPTGVHLRGLAARTSTYDANNIERSRTTFEYDNYTPDSGTNNRHAALVPYGDIFGLCTTFDTAGNCSNSSPAFYTTRGNITGTTKYLLDQNGNVTGSVTANQQYDIAGNIVKSVDVRVRPDGGGDETVFDFSDNYGSPDAEAKNNTAPPGLGSLRSYSLTRSVTNALGHAAYTQYDYYTGQPVNFEDVNNQVQAFEYNDLLDRATKMTPPPGRGQVVNEYGDTIGNLFVKVRTQLDSNVWKEGVTYYDGLGRVTKTQSHDATGDIFSETVYDSLGHIKKTSGPHRSDELAHWVETTYDELGRVKEVTSPKIGDEPTPAKLKSEYSVAATGVQLGLVCIGINQADKRARSITNAQGQLIRVDEPDAAGNLGPIDSPNRPTYYQYDTLGNLIKVTQGSQTRYFMYDSLGRLIRIRQPEQDTNPNLALSDAWTGNSDWSTGFTYDENGNVLTITDPKGVVMSQEYDSLNRVVRKSYSTPVTTDPKKVTSTTSTVTYKYDGELSPTPNNPNPPTVPFAKGLLTEVSNGVSTTQFTSFDNLGRVLSSKQVVDGQEYPFGYKYTLPGALNLSGALMEETYPSGRVVTNTLDSSGELSSVSSHIPNQAAKVYASELRYTADRSIDRIKLGNNTWETYKVNARDQITQIGLGTSETDTSLWRVNYDYGRFNPDETLDGAKNDGNVVRQTITVPGVAAPYVQTYTYDPLNRLTEARETNGGQQTWRQTYEYDRYGNRTGFSQITGQTQLVLNNVTLPEIDSLTNRFKAGQGYEYDLNGNLIQDAAGRKSDFDGNNKQSAVKDANGNVIATYGYDGNGRRVKKTVAATQEVTVFVYDVSGKLAAEYSSVRPQNPTTRYITADILETPRVITDNSGAVNSRKDYMPFGEELFEARSGNQQYGYDTGVRQGFTGYEKDDETQLNFAEARYYNPAHGRFTTVDPMLASGASTNPQSFNRYAYAGNNPALRTDPDGEDWFIGSAPDRMKLTADGLSVHFEEHFWSPKPLGLAGYEKVRSYVNYYNAGANRGWYALDPYEPRLRRVASEQAGYAQLEKYKRQAVLNFVMGAAEAVSLTFDLVHVQAVERDTEMYAAGHRIGVEVQVLSLVTGAGFANAIISRFGKGGLAIARKALPVLNEACFVAGTPVHTDHGLKAIEEIKVGDKVLSWNELGKRFEYKTVVQVYVRQAQRLVSVRITGEQVPIVATPEHPFYARAHRARDGLGAEDGGEEAGEWVAAGELRPGDELMRPDGVWAEVESVESEKRAESVYNFEVEDNHNYFVGETGALVHNNCNVATLLASHYGKLQSILARRGVQFGFGSSIGKAEVEAFAKMVVGHFDNASEVWRASYRGSDRLFHVDGNMVVVTQLDGTFESIWEATAAQLAHYRTGTRIR